MFQDLVSVDLIKTGVFKGKGALIQIPNDIWVAEFINIKRDRIVVLPDFPRWSEPFFQAVSRSQYQFLFF